MVHKYSELPAWAVEEIKYLSAQVERLQAERNKLQRELQVAHDNAATYTPEGHIKLIDNRHY